MKVAQTAIIIAEPAGVGTWDVWLVEIGPELARQSMRLQPIALDWQSGCRSIGELGNQILRQAQNRSIESIVLLPYKDRFEETAAVVNNGSRVPIHVIDPVAVLEYVLPVTWTSFLLIDLHVPEESVLMQRKAHGKLERAFPLPLFGARSGMHLSPILNQRVVHKNCTGAQRSSVSILRLKRWVKAASVVGVTRVLFRTRLFDPEPEWRERFSAVKSSSKQPVETLFLSAQDLVLGVLKSWRNGDASRRAVVLSESAGAATLTMSCQRSISYSVVHPARSVLDLEHEELAGMLDGRPVLLVVDNNVQRLFGQRIKAYSDKHLNCLGRVVLEGTDQRKGWDQVKKICSKGVLVGLPREGVIVAFGGGVTLDLSGTASSLFRRGVLYLRVPTTLVGMVDTAVGIKQGFNFMSKKNILGSFYPPLGVINDSTFLGSLPQAELSFGVAEIIKMAVVRDRHLIETLECNAALLLRNRFQSPPEEARRVLLRAEQLMMQELQPNLFEGCHARLPDFGHTFSPGLERASAYTMRHGHAVALDMLISTGVAIRRGLCDERVFERMVHLYEMVGLPLQSSLITMEVLLGSAREACLHRSGALNLVVPLDFGRATYLQDLEPEDLKYSLAMMEQAAHETVNYNSTSAGV